jgi:hypothetical protein
VAKAARIPLRRVGAFSESLPFSAEGLPTRTVRPQQNLPRAPVTEGLWEAEGFILRPGRGCGIFEQIDCGGENE